MTNDPNSVFPERPGALSISLKEVAGLVPDGITVAICGNGGGMVEADALMEALETSFLQSGHPRDLTIVHALGIGDGNTRGLQRFAHEGMVKRVIGGHWSWGPGMQRLAREDKIEAYTFPAGVIQTLFREIGANRPGVITRVGLGTFADPENGGGKVTARTTEDLVEKIELNGEEYLFYKAIPIDVGLVRASLADSNGNLSLQHEAVDMDAHVVALAAHNSGGLVIAQVKELTEEPILPARLIRIPGLQVNYLVHVPDSDQCRGIAYDPVISGEQRAELHEQLELPDGVRGMIARRAALELGEARSVNFGFGIPDGVAAYLKSWGKEYWGTVEQGTHNGSMLGGALFGAARNPEAIVSSVDQFDFYSGGGVETCFLGMGEMDAEGNVNVSWLGEDLVGPGGFVDISQPANKVVFCGTFEAKGLKVSQTDEQISIDRYGDVGKLVKRVKHITFSGKQAIKSGQQVVYVTERAVFELTSEGVALVELAPGVDLQTDVLERMQFTPVIKLRQQSKSAAR